MIFKSKKNNFPQDSYDSLFACIENDLRELGQGDVAVNKKMKDLNKLFYDILLKLNKDKSDSFKINKDLILKYFSEFNINSEKYDYFNTYFEKFYHFCFELSPNNMVKETLNFKV